MKKNIIKHTYILISALLLGILSFSLNIQEQNKEIKIKEGTANAICRTYYNDITVCCLKGNSGCSNAVNSEHRGPYYYGMDAQ